MLAQFLKRVSQLTLVVSCIFLPACQGKDSKVQRPQPLPQDPSIQVYFNHNQAQGADYQEPYRDITRPGDNLEQKIIDAIASANTSIDLAVQELRLPKIAQALVERQQAGVAVRVIIENIYSRPWSTFSQQEVRALDARDRDSYEEARALIDLNKDGKLSASEIQQRDALVILKNAGVPLIDDTEDGTKGSGLMHHKFMVIDNLKTIVTSANFTTSGIHGDFGSPESRGNANNLLLIESPLIAKAFTEEFNLMWGDGPGGEFDSLFGLQKPERDPVLVNLGNSAIAVHFSPTSAALPWQDSSNGLIVDTLSTAQESINLALFVFSEQLLVDWLAQRHQQGVQINALIDPSFAFRYYSEALDMLGVALANKCTYEPNNRPWNPPISSVGIPQLPRGDKLHHKFAVVDEKTVITGSHNWSSAANINNDETLIVIQNSTVAAHFVREFDRLFEDATLGIPPRVQQEIEKQQQTCPKITTPTATLAPEAIINLNTASQQELEALPGIGPALAKRIIAARQERPFTSLEDLQRVSGIGPVSIERLRGKVIW